ncbi:hypothetical protein BGM25_03540 [Bacillus sp. FJAT-29953]|nr:hypothetical protein [Bacillus sp. FJAT-29953]
MKKKTVLKVAEDFCKKNVCVGEELAEFGGRLKIVDLAYENEFGTFILCEYTSKNDDEAVDNQWERREGAALNPNRPLEIVGTIHIPGYRNMMGGIGFFIKNHTYDEVMGLSYQQAWNVIFHEGARNAMASSSHYRHFRTKLLAATDGLPALDSWYWKVPAYTVEGIPYAPLTNEALLEIKKGMANAVDGLVRAQVQKAAVPHEEVDLFNIRKISELMNTAKNIVVLSGAGLSTQSGIPDYRSSVESMWRKNPQVLAQLNQAAFERDPRAFWKAMYQLIQESLSLITPFRTHDSLIATIRALKPNGGHQFLAWLHTQLKKDVNIITQNVDGLDKKAGSNKVVEMHGNILECVCPDCHRVYPLVEVLREYDVPTCVCGDVLRPNVVFFGDEVRQFEQALDAVGKADLILVVGTTLQVYPFNRLLHGKSDHAKVVLLNGTSVEHDVGFDFAAYGDISRLFYEMKRLMM